MNISPIVSSRATHNKDENLGNDEDIKNYLSHQKANRKISYRFKSIDRQLGRQINNLSSMLDSQDADEIRKILQPRPS